MTRQVSLIVVAAALLPIAPVPAGILSQAQAGPRGLVWKVTGNWHVGESDAVLTNGDLISPGSRVYATGAVSRRLIILLPDGQRLFLECHDQPSCSRGFRLPALTQPVDNETALTFQEIGAQRGKVMKVACGSEDSSDEPEPVRQQPNLLRTEAVAILGDDGLVNIATAMKSMPLGDYRVVSKSSSGIAELSIHWDGQKALSIPLRKTGMYDLRYYGSLNTERMRECLLVVGRAEFEDANKRLTHWKEILTQWDQRSPGWPIHEFLSLYLDAISTTTGLARAPSVGPVMDYFGFVQHSA